jgi:hypothetical protein
VQIDPHLTLRVFRGGINTDGHSDEQNYLDELVREWQVETGSPVVQRQSGNHGESP